MSFGRGGRARVADVDGLTIFALRGIAPELLEAVRALWNPDRSFPGRPGGTATPARLRSPAGSALEVVPVFDGEELVALVYVETAAVIGGTDLAAVARASRDMAGIIRSAERPATAPMEAFLERTGVEDFRREKLLLLLDRHGWNIAKVARLMGITRRTVYLQLRRYGIARKRVPRGRRGRSAP